MKKGNNSKMSNGIYVPFNGNPLRMIQAKFGLNWPSGFRGEDFFKSLPFAKKTCSHLVIWTSTLSIIGIQKLFVIGN